MKYQKQNSTIETFREGKINLLIATNIGEGLDIQLYNVVIMFDCVLNLRSYIQSCGRARRINLFYFLFYEKDNIKDIETFRKLQDDAILAKYEI